MKQSWRRHDDLPGFRPPSRDAAGAVLTTMRFRPSGSRFVFLIETLEKVTPHAPTKRKPVSSRTVFDTCEPTMRTLFTIERFSSQ
eukprot:scaffold442_cov268-Pinguiococcus_pyrenoidosus.AAC.113